MSAQLGISDVISIFIAVIRILVIDLPLFSLSLALASQNSANYDLAIPELLQLFLIRRNEAYTQYIRSLWSLFPPRAVRYTSDIGLPHKILNSKRYGPYCQNLFVEVKVDDHIAGSHFRGRWIVRNSIVGPTSSNARDSAIVIFYLHGGGYFSSSAATYFLFLLRLAETIIRSGKTVSIFALEYDLAPEHTFPTQLRQARAAYSWLRDEIGVNRSQLLVMGDSAGAHLTLSLMVDLWKPLDSTGNHSVGVKDEKSDSRPGLGLVLVSPWLSLYHQPDSFTRNAVMDILAGPALHTSAVQFLGPSHCKPWPNRSPYLEFLTPDPPTDWDAVLPEWVWVSAGKNEILYDDIVRWIVDRGTDCIGKSRIDGEVDKAEAHVYAWLKTTDPALRKGFLNTDMKDKGSEDTEMEAFAPIERIGQAIVGRYQKLSGQL